MSIPAKKGETVYLATNLSDGEEGMYPQAVIYRAGTGTKVATVSLIHRADGVYDAPWTPEQTGIYTALFITYMDADHTVENIIYGRASEQIIVSSASVDDLSVTLARSMGLLHENAFIDNTVYSGASLIGARVRIFEDSESAQAATDGGSETAGLIGTYTITSEIEGAAGQMKTYRMVRVA